MFIIENITDIFLPIWTLWVQCAWCLDLHTSVFRIWIFNLRTFVAKYRRGDLHTFWRKILKARFTRICRETFTPGSTHFFRNFFFDWKGYPANVFAFRMNAPQSLLSPSSSSVAVAFYLFKFVCPNLFCPYCKCERCPGGRWEEYWKTSEI